jgi:hypothetical protein
MFYQCTRYQCTRQFKYCFVCQEIQPRLHPSSRSSQGTLVSPFLNTCTTYDVRIVLINVKTKIPDSDPDFLRVVIYSKIRNVQNFADFLTFNSKFLGCSGIFLILADVLVFVYLLGTTVVKNTRIDPV